MEVTNRRDIWNKRYADKPAGLPTPHVFLCESIEHFQPGSVIDMACGLGHNAVYLANHGYKVYAVDFSTEALNRLDTARKADDLKIELLELDLTTSDSFTNIPISNNIVVLRYKLSMTMIERIPDLLQKNGLFLYCTFNQEHHKQTGFPNQHCLLPGELLKMSWNMELVSYRSFTWEGASYDGYIFKKL